ncbi:MAG: radical SAM protein [Candidatus Iainarchaeum archaeon]|uniref:Radical SAM protein n=1 Tax=Candidatus Iainarchaeum sp. TaxID=3101447 RepID=A0A7T9DKS0_9ARCH|nr:MAG: radical SAM protein [Candidatus Diapherotrites archaeon]
MIYPTELSIELTNICNLKCVLCDNPNIPRPKGFMDFEKFKKLIDETDRHVKRVNFGVTAEPLLHPQVDQFIAYAKSKGKYTILTSNATRMVDFTTKLINAGLDAVVLSLDGMTRETYEKYRKGAVVGINNFDAAKTGIEILCQKKESLNKKNPHVIVSFLVNRYNEHEIDTAKEWSKKMKVDTLLLKAMHFAWAGGKEEDAMREWAPKNKEFIRQYDYTKLGICAWTNNSTVVYWDGELASCCFDLIGRTTFGNAFTEGFVKIWESEDHKSKQVEMAKRTLAQCVGCSSGVKLGTYVNNKSFLSRITQKIGGE